MRKNTLYFNNRIYNNVNQLCINTEYFQRNYIELLFMFIYKSIYIYDIISPIYIYI